MGGGGAYINGQVGVEEDLEVVIGRAGVPDDEAGPQVVLAEGDGIGQIEGVVPFASVDHAVREAEVELDGGIAFAVREGG